jgi:hypothetical protein
LIDLGQVGATQGKRKRAIEVIQSLLHWPIIVSLALLVGGLAVAYAATISWVALPYSQRIGEIGGSLLDFNGIVLSLLVAFATIYLPVIEGKRAQAVAKAKETHDGWVADRDSAQWKGKQRDYDLVKVPIVARVMVMASEYRDRMLLFASLLVVSSGILSFVLLDSYYFFLSNSLSWQPGGVKSVLYAFVLLSPAITLGLVIVILVFVVRDVAGGSSTWKASKKMTEDYIFGKTGIKVSIGRDGQVEILG